MKDRRIASEDEVVLAFLRGELSSETLLRSAELASDPIALAAIDEPARMLLARVLRNAAHDFGDGPVTVVHGEPHNGNVLMRAGEAILIDLEGAKVAPVEWDLAFRSEDEVRQFWPSHDSGLLAQLRVAVSAGVATYCWRHVTARPHEEDIRWHAEHHLALVREAEQPHD